MKNLKNSKMRLTFFERKLFSKRAMSFVKRLFFFCFFKVLMWSINLMTFVTIVVYFRFQKSLTFSIFWKIFKSSTFLSNIIFQLSIASTKLSWSSRKSSMYFRKTTSSRVAQWRNWVVLIILLKSFVFSTLSRKSSRDKDWIE